MTRLTPSLLAPLVFVLGTILLPAVAQAVPSVGAERPRVRLVDGWDRPIDLSKVGPKPLIVVYEDSHSATQNQPFKADLAALASGDRYRASVALVPVADVQGYDYWPVRGFVKDAIQDESRKLGAPIYCDWDGTALRAFGLRRGVSNVILYGKDGRVMFSHEGPMSVAERQEAIALLRREVGD